MGSYLIQGGKRLSGTVRIHGAKNSVLPVLTACVCCAGTCEIHNCPQISDVDTSVAILRHLGCRVVRQEDVLTVDAGCISRCDIPAGLMRGMRSSVLFLGALLSRCGEACLVPPGGCALGKRPIDLHLWAAERLGACCTVCGDQILCQAERLQGGVLPLRCPSVGATENAMLAALGCCGETVILNAAREPEIVDLAEFLQCMGARVQGAGTCVITVGGAAPLRGCTFSVMPDRIEAATYLCAAAGCGGNVFLEGAEAGTLQAVLPVLAGAGCAIENHDDGLWIRAPGRLQAPGDITTGPYPEFPTDAQAPVMAAVLRAYGDTGFTETIFENRMRHVEQLKKLGADISASGCRALVRGVPALNGADLQATDLRCGAALVIGALQAEGESRISGIQYIARGYEDLDGGLRSIGAAVTPVENSTKDTHAAASRLPRRRI